MVYTRRIRATTTPYSTLYGIPVTFSHLFKGTGVGLLKFSSGKVKIIGKGRDRAFYIQSLCRNTSEDLLREIIIDEAWYRSYLLQGDFNAHYIGTWGPD